MSGPTISELVVSSLDALGCPGRATGVRRLGGGSGADVFRLTVAGRALVLKVTTDEGWLPGARRERRVYTDLAEMLDGRIPTVLATDDDGSAVRMLMVEHESGPAAALLGVEDWRQVAGELGRLHRSGPPPGWLTRAPWPRDDEVAGAVDRWSALGHGALAAAGAALLPAARARLESLPPVLIHGDCHLGNLLRTERGISWIDWQEAGLGVGPEDLALLVQRAEADGGDPPRALMLERYRAARGLAVDVDLAGSLAAAELRLLVVDWPVHLLHLPADRRRPLVRGLEGLVAGTSDGAS